ncbi:MAG: AAA family ATPase [Moritella sp.]|uniref:AAA family ATPase n=1 Tax=Moritella sp. TaxID=78556 RepID=UPI0029AD937E|nr:AAA family ATPase [Moritella sp.]MDX2322482.1 AAA family ATPase [Moritella sp.]
MLTEKITADKLVPVFDLSSRCKLEEFDTVTRDQLFPQNNELFSLFHETATAKLLVATDFDGFDHLKSFSDILRNMSHKRAKSICYIEDITTVGRARAFEIWRDKTELFKQLIEQIIATGKCSNEQLNTCLIKAYPSILPLLLNLNEFNVEYAFKILADEHTAGSNIVDATNLNQATLFGNLDTLYKNNSYTSNVAQLIPGLLHQAHGGYIVIKIDELIINSALWYQLKSVIKQGTLSWSSSNQTIQTELKPDPAPLDVKVILLGDRLAISQLTDGDRELSSLATSFIDFSPEFNITEQDIANYIGYIKLLLADSNLLPLSDCGLKRLLQLSSRWCEHNNYLSLNEAKLTTLLNYCHQIASANKLKYIDSNTLNRVLKLQHEALNGHIRLSNEGIIEKQIILETDGNKIGQINGLSVLEIHGHPESFGEPIRITATGHLNGDGDISDVERKAELAGNIHAKSMMIIQGFFTHTFAKPLPLPISANLVFEQSYGEIDGDSAALAGTCALLSVLAQKPIAQNLAVTGAIDQFGTVLAVGGINEKLEGFQRICELNEQTNIGVLIPAANIVNLNLSDKLIDAVTSGQLAIYPVTHIDEAIELLMGIKAGKVDEQDSLYNIIQLLAEEQDDKLEDNDTCFVTKIKQLYAKIIGKQGCSN